MKTLELYLNSASDFSIQDASGKVYTVAEAKRLYQRHWVSGYNMAFQRLINFDFDMEACKESFKMKG